MFWRKTRDAIEKLHPMHQMIVFHRVLYTTQDRPGWAALTNSIGVHHEVVKRGKWNLPPRTLDVLLPLVAVLMQDLPAVGVVSISADLRGSKVPDKAGPRQDLPVRRPVRSATQWYEVDPWLRINATLRDGSRIDLSVVDRIRYRRVHKVNPRGKHKTRTKTKELQFVRVTRTLPPGMTGRRPDRRPPPWLRIKVRPGRREVMTATGRMTGIAAGNELVNRILSVMTEPFRWTPPGTGTPRREAAA